MNRESGGDHFRWHSRPPRVITIPREVRIAGSARDRRAPKANGDSHYLALAFAPLHKRALGVATGTACAILMAALTLFHLLLHPQSDLIPTLLSQYFYGYDLTWIGLLVGSLWGAFVGFIMGWFVAFSRNLALAASIFLTRTRAELRATRDFLDHI